MFRSFLSYGSLLFLLSGCDVSNHPIDVGKLLETSTKEVNISGIEKNLLASAKKSEEAGDSKQALAYYQQLADKYPAKMEYKVAQAEQLRRTGQLEPAIKLFDEILAKDEKNVEALEGKMLCVLSKSDFSTAASLVEKIMALDSNRWRTLNAGGILFASKGLTDEAIQYYERALSISKDNPSILNNVGLTLALDKQYDKAVETLKQGSDFASKNASLRQRIDMNLALVYGIAGKSKEAEKVAGKYISGPALYNNLGYYAHLAKNNTLAKDYLNMALTKSSVYYERAWTNLENMSGDTPSQKHPDSKNENAAEITSVKTKRGPKPKAASSKPVVVSPKPPKPSDVVEIKPEPLPAPPAPEKPAEKSSLFESLWSTPENAEKK